MDHGSMQQLMGGGFEWFWAIIWVVVLALLVAGAIWLARTLTRPSNPPADPARRGPSWTCATPAAS